MIAKKFLLAALWTALIFLNAGCGGQVKYYPGLITRNVEGAVHLENASPEDRPFIVVEKYRQTFFETSSGYLHKVTADVVHPGKNGAYSVNFDTDVNQIRLNFIARGFLRGSFSFKRSLGIGKYRYEVRLKKDPEWKRQFFILIKPFLSAYITEKRYMMKDHDQLFLGDWINETEKRFQNIYHQPAH